MEPGKNHVGPQGLHVAVIMDGNGRWAASRGWPRLAGHHEGTRSVRRAVEAAPGLGIGTLTLYAFSSDNWRRPRAEVVGLMRLLSDTVRREIAACVEEGVRITFIGRRDRLPKAVLRAMERAERDTAGGARLELRIAIDYSARDAIVRAATRMDEAQRADRESFERLLGEALAPGGRAGEVDLMIRTGGEQRLSDFLLWECAYAELYFTPVLWPDFNARHLEEAVRDFHARERRFGGLPSRVAS
jgi:undecaprenyl diphosphate synthase